MTANVAPSTMTVAAAAKALGEHVADLRKAIRNEEVPVIRTGRQVRVLTDWVRDPAGWRARHLADMADSGKASIEDDDARSDCEPRNVAYARVSTSRQTTEQQVAALESAGCSPIFTETMSGKRADRPQLAAALAELKPGDTLTVWKLDRLGRDALQMLATIKDLNDRGIIVRSLTEGLDSGTEVGRMVMGILAHVAEYELALKTERAEAKRQLIRRRGGSLGGAKPKFDAEQAAAVRRAHASGDTVSELARIHRVSRPTIYRVLEGQR